MNNQIWQAIGAVIFGFIGAIITVITSIFVYYTIKKYVPILRAKTAKWLETNREPIRLKVQNWLHENNLQESKLLDVYLDIDAVAGNVQKVLVYVETKETGKVKVSESELSIEEFGKMNTNQKEKVIKEVGKMSIMSQVM
ncbi:hypothetical protein I8752_29635 [Nostocaceae cyanobacterium CENA369]|uniref:Uncharacterized protein n=1 Tax=Dendronalium phyllosphericum CENA369 TaxID=1725256 RepID=A0A8J7IEN9_9NOST|nr:hypothetical protein [Dendronalium phyllosphericum]MBH8577071.1 hypothetical protein [Dendronalium phyllosphericum CENA369]